MDVSVIIAVSRPDAAREAFASLCAQQCAGQYEIILVGDVDAIAVPETDVDIVQVPAMSPELRSAAARRNRGVRSAQGSILAFLDDDATAPPEWLERGIQLFDRDDLLGIVGGPNVSPPDADSRERLSDAVLNTPLVGAGNSAYRPGAKGDYVRPARVGDIHLVNCFVRRDVFDAVGGFNEGLGYGGEDSEFLYLAQRVYGARAVFVPHLLVHHHRRPFGWAYLTQRFRLRRNSGRLMWAHPGMYIAHPIILALGVGLLISAGALVTLSWATVQWLGVAAALAYVVMLAWLTVTHARGLGGGLFIFPFALAAHHVANVLGLALGVASIVWMRGFADLKRGSVWAHVGYIEPEMLAPAEEAAA